MPKVMIINRPLVIVRGFPIPTRRWQPLYSMYVATILNQKGIETEIIDARAMRYNEHEVKKILEIKKPEIVMVASDTCDVYENPSPYLVSFAKIINITKDIESVKHVLSMGAKATIFDEALLKSSPIDYIIKGDDPITAANLIFDLAREQKNDYPNVSYRRGQEIHLGEIGALENLDELPVGDYSLLPMEEYKSNISFFPQGRFSILITSRGCFGNCKFCYKQLIGQRLRAMSIERVKDELDQLVKKFQVKTIYFLDDLFTYDRKRTIELCEMIKRENYDILWGCQTRTDMVDLELLKIMKQAGCFYIAYGVESGNQDILRRSGKNINLEEAQRVLDETRSLGIRAHTNMLYGFPGETKQEFNDSINFLIKNKEFSTLQPIILFPGTRYYKEITPGKSLKEMERMALDFSLTKLKQNDIDRGFAKLNIYRMINNKEYNYKIFYFILKYLFPGLNRKLKGILKK